jgi:hypothetical protein
MLAAMSLLLSLSAAADPQTCHIHPPTALRDLESEPVQLYPSLQECESANRKVYGGTGRCHCSPDGFMNREGIDSWRFRQWNFEMPSDRIP